MSDSVKDLKKKLFYDNKNGTRREADRKAAEAYCVGYAAFLDKARTERLATAEAIRLAEQNGFVPFDANASYRPGDRVYVNNHKKSAIFAVIGKKPVEEGLRMVAAHIDSPRLDLKPNPLYENTELAYFKTHYYGGIKKYQWAVLPLALHGVFALKDGTVFDVAIGDEPDDPCFVVSDILPHLGAEQAKRSAGEVIRGEELNILVGSYPFKDDEESEMVKLNVLNILFEKYGVTEADFLSAELEAVPALPVKDVGFDRSLIGAYGHDDRVCAYPALTALFDAKEPEYTAVTVLADKEEIGSEGTTGLNSSLFAFFAADLARMQGAPASVVLRNSKCLSADVNAAFDPTFSDVFEPQNTAYLNHGVVLTKYTGARGKSSSNDASAEYMAEVRAMLDQAEVGWQIGELGKVDAGGGGTVAKYVSALGVTTVDLGVPVLAMHAPFEIVSKYDVYMTYRACLAFFR